jgi:hypothetical protein
MTWNKYPRSPLVPLLAASLLALVRPGVASADIIRFTADLSGSQEVPPNASPATGMGDFFYDTNTNTVLSGNLSFSGLMSPQVSAHIHEAQSGVNGQVIIPLPFGSPVNLAGLTFTDPEETALLAGNTYFDVHTQTLIGGEIRGQIIAQPAAVPEPSTLILVGIGLPVMIVLGKKRLLEKGGKGSHC